MLKRIYSAFLLVTVLLLSVSGCGNHNDTPLIVRRKDAARAKTIENVEGMDIADQVQVPKEYKTKLTGGGGTVNVTVDAGFVIPNATGFKLKRVERKRITQEEVDRQKQVLLRGQNLTRRKYQENDPAEGWTKDELRETIEHLEKRMADNHEWMDKESIAYDEEYLIYLHDLLLIAPQTFETEQVDMTLSGGNSDYIGGETEIDGIRYGYFVENNFTRDNTWIQSMLERDALDQNYIYNQSDLDNMDLKGKDMTPSISMEEAIKQGDSLVEELELDHMKLAANEYGLAVDNMDAGPNMTVTDKACRLHYTRMIEGIPITYTNEQGLSVGVSEAIEKANQYTAEGEMVVETTADMEAADEQYSFMPWQYEGLTLTYDGQGLVSFHWYGPYVITDLSDEYVFLMPFSEIQTIFEEMILKKEEEFISDFLVRADYHVKEVRLGYTRVRDSNSSTVGTLIPVWDFFGTREWHYAENGVESEYVKDTSPFQSLLTINAMDGSVVDRAYGY